MNGEDTDATPLHRVLARQLRRLRLSAATAPDPAAWPALLKVVSESYTQADSDRYTLERSIDISSAEMRGLHDVLSRRALQDGLTGLPNRAALLERISELLAGQRSGGPAAAMLFIDLDGFKPVNDSLGHQAGDELLVRAAERMSTVAGDHLVTRLGGDEFVIACPRIAGLPAAQTLAGRVVLELQRPFRIGGRDVVVGASIGVALTSSRDLNADDVLRRADLAMYAAKTGGRARFVVFDERMRSDVDTRVSITTDLHSALARDELRLHYQPVVRLRDGRVIGAEALVRWKRPGQQRLLAPEEFLPIAQEIRLIGDIDTWVITHACLGAAEWCAKGGEIAVNLAQTTLAATDVVQTISSALQASGISPHQLQIELTEAALLTESAIERANLDGMRALGVRLALDDFGAGHSALAGLRTIDVQALKLHASLIEAMDQQENVAAFVGAVISMGHALGHRVIAEGVERRAQADLLRAFGCDDAQGFLFGYPDLAQELDQAFQKPDQAALTGGPAQH